ncbi:DEAD/DEAH box helicase [Denitratisoma oestradiolicum]|uniref:DEAD-box ATP-dependent RNA helicase RhpA n=1 Tax=Denitratisoma oestradiolicum TaxID=311182 RepID=A0A6S6XY46_9PROT|nr:DEAD/DEAH box helicase [Denitratisoma oestradiolicum]TWO81094.1 RNA helicase [Denitratisoma oestradiolicum]CAB1367772.1 RNA helicase [Denitratisoma oestradiolicum]
MSFSSLGLRAEILKSIAGQGYDTPTPIQSQAIPIALQGRDLMAAAQTGTGKTAGFTLPILHLLSADSALSVKRFKPRALILTPTRELAVQVHDSVRTYGAHLPLRATAIYGGVSMGPQTRALKSGTDIVVATPGRLLDHINERNADLSGIEILVLDEADRMLDMGFIRDIRRIISLLPKKKQSLLFSATFSDEIRGLAQGLLVDPISVEVARRNAPAEAVAQAVYPVDRVRKKDLLVKLIKDHSWHQVLVFTRTKHGADALARHLEQNGISSAALHGNKTQGARQRALDDFKRLKVNVLVATDIAARGIDIDQLPQVVNYELPNVPEDYVHRIGRTGRAGADGAAISLVCIDEQKLLRDIEKVLKRGIEKRMEPGFEPDPSIRPEPLQKPRVARPGGFSSRGPAGPGRSDAARRSPPKPRSGANHHSGSRHR